MTQINVDIDFSKLIEDVACIKQAILGNGQPGLCQRINQLESEERNRNRLTGIVGGLGVVAGSIITYLTQIFKG